MSLRICILETDILRPELVDQYQGYGHMFEQLFAQQPVTAEFSVYNVVEGHYPPDSEKFDAYLVTGSKADSFGSDPWIQTLKAYLLERYKRGDKLLGICFGHQILAHALGGKVSRLPHNREFGCQPVYLTPQGLAHPWLRDFPSGSSTLQSHQDHVATLPPGAQGLGSSSTTEHQIFSLGNALGVQFHPEYTPDTLRIIARSRLKC